MLTGRLGEWDGMRWDTLDVILGRSIEEIFDFWGLVTWLVVLGRKMELNGVDHVTVVLVAMML